jgi:hypothetical protein
MNRAQPRDLKRDLNPAPTLARGTQNRCVHRCRNFVSRCRVAILMRTQRSALVSASTSAPTIVLTTAREAGLVTGLSEASAMVNACQNACEQGLQRENLTSLRATIVASDQHQARWVLLEIHNVARAATLLVRGAAGSANQVLAGSVAAVADRYVRANVIKSEANSTAPVKSVARVARVVSLAALPTVTGSSTVSAQKHEAINRAVSVGSRPRWWVAK